MSVMIVVSFEHLFYVSGFVAGHPHDACDVNGV